MSTPKNTQDPLVKSLSESITKLAKINNWKRPTKSLEEQLKEQQLQQQQNSPLNYYWGEQKSKSNSLYEYASQNNPEYIKNEPTKYSGELKYLPSKRNDYAKEEAKINRIKGDWHPNTPNAIINAFNTTDLDREAGASEFSSQSLERELDPSIRFREEEQHDQWIQAMKEEENRRQRSRRAYDDNYPQKIPEEERMQQPNVAPCDGSGPCEDGSTISIEPIDPLARETWDRMDQLLGPRDDLRAFETAEEREDRSRRRIVGSEEWKRQQREANRE